MSHAHTAEPIDILLVEDSPGDQELTREAFKQGRIANTLHVVADGEQAMDFLYARGDYPDACTPDLILLDLNLPRKDGREVLADIKADDKLKTIPIIVLTTSDAEKDILKSYQLSANCYITKPVDFHEFMEAIKALETFWLSVVKLPPQQRLNAY